MNLAILSKLFWGSFALLLATWIIYPIVLSILARIKSGVARPGAEQARALMTILIAAHNEQRNIDSRIGNILEMAPTDFDIELIVASDGSTDKTCEISRAWAAKDRRVSVFETSGARGKVAAHNQGVLRAKGEIIVFTDAETEFDRKFLDKIGHAFDDPKVGFASGELIWRNKSGGVTGENFTLYWRYETWLRKLETAIGIHALGTGACSAVRKTLYRPIAPQADQDFVTPLDAILQGYRTVFVPDAKAYDFVSETATGEFRARIRMTAKNFLNTFSHWGLSSFFRFPATSVGLVFHKLFRWLTPYFAAILLLAGAVMMAIGSGSMPVTALTLLGWAGLIYGLLGAVVPSLPFAGSIWSFMIANAAFAIGVWKALTGQVPTAFR